VEATTAFRRAVLFGGSGFIGSHLARQLIERRVADSVLIADIAPPKRALGERTTLVRCDVRAPISSSLSDVQPDLIVNLAAIHREPGHESHEYFQTNLKGAENVCEYARAVACTHIVFTSSISVYGPTDDERDEDSLPVPVSPYGASKLVAEHIHRTWQVENAEHKLVVVRPGVVFGPHEGGNVSRLVKAVTRGYFVYLGNQDVRKAGGYVGELCNTIFWALERVEASRTLLYNFSMEPIPRLEEFVAAIANELGRNAPSTSVPYRPILTASYVAQFVSDVIGIRQPLHPTRARKLMRSNNIIPAVLRSHGYTPRFTLASALHEWRLSEPAEWQ